MACGGLHFPDTCPVPDDYIYYVDDMINDWDIISTFSTWGPP